MKKRATLYKNTTGNRCLSMTVVTPYQSLEFKDKVKQVFRMWVKR